MSRSEWLTIKNSAGAFDDDIVSDMCQSQQQQNRTANTHHPAEVCWVEISIPHFFNATSVSPARYVFFLLRDRRIFLVPRLRKLLQGVLGLDQRGCVVDILPIDMRPMPWPVRTAEAR